MRKLWEAAFNPPPRASDADTTGFAVLPQNTEEDIRLSEVHSQLDRALNFLQRDVGYALLDDVRPTSGGGVRLRQAPPKHAAVPKGERSAREPQVRLSGEDPLLRTSTSPHNSPEDVDQTIMKLLYSLFERSGGKLRASELAEEVYRRQASNFKMNGNGQLDRLFGAIRIDEDRELTWQEFELLMRESKVAPASASTAPAPRAGQTAPSRVLTDPQCEEIVLSPEVSRYAHFQCDLVLVSRFATILLKSILQDLNVDADKGLMTHEEAKKRCSQAIKHDGVYKCVLQGVRLMHLCDYDYADVVLVLGYAAIYFRSTFSSIGKKMSPNEAAHVVVLLIYLAHAFLLDETCPLRIWQKHIFRKYCTLKVLDAALFRLFQMRPGFKLRISESEERDALIGLSGFHAFGLPEDPKEASEAIKQMMGSGFTHPKLLVHENKEVQRGTVSSNGSPADAEKVSSKVSNSRKCPNNGTSAVHSGSSSGGSNGRSPPSAPGSGQSAERLAEATAVRARSSAQAPSVQAGRVSEATNLLTSARAHRESQQRRSDRSSKEPTYASNRSDEGVMHVGHADRPLSAAAAVAK